MSAIGSPPTRRRRCAPPLARRQRRALPLSGPPSARRARPQRATDQPGSVVRQQLPARAVFLALTWSSAAAKKTGQEQEAAASVPARPITFDCGDEAVGVDEADDQ